METIDLTWIDVRHRAGRVASRIYKERPKQDFLNIYGIPNGGIPAALAVAEAATGDLRMVDTPEQADVFIDDIVDSGETRRYYLMRYGNHPFYALVDKQQGDNPTAWWSFPWERMQKQDGPHDNVRRLLQYIGEDAEREGLKGTPDRVVRSYDELFSGYKADPSKILTVFEQDCCDEMVLLKDIDIVSMCEHHMLPFLGRAHIAYIPDGRVVGVSKLVRLLEVYSRRLQIQERLTEQVTHALMEHLKPQGAACVIQAQHLCMVARGVQKQHSIMTTSSLEGVFRKPEVRAEFLSMIGK